MHSEDELAGLTNEESEEFMRLRDLTDGTNISIERIGPANVKISEPGKKGIVKQLAGNTSISATAIVKAKLALQRKKDKY